MARFISVEIDASQLRVAEIEEVGRKERILQCFSIPMPQGMTEDGEVRDTKNLAELLVQGLEAHAIKSKKIYFVAGSSRIASRRIQRAVVSVQALKVLRNCSAMNWPSRCRFFKILKVQTESGMANSFICMQQ